MEMAQIALLNNPWKGTRAGLATRWTAGYTSTCRRADDGRGGRPGQRRTQRGRRRGQWRRGRAGRSGYHRNRDGQTGGRAGGDTARSRSSSSRDWCRPLGTGSADGAPGRRLSGEEDGQTMSWRLQWQRMGLLSTRRSRSDSRREKFDVKWILFSPRSRMDRCSGSCLPSTSSS